MYKKLVFIFMALICVVPSFLNAQMNFLMRPYAKFGYLLAGPTASDLSYIVIGGDPEQYFELNKTNFGAGVQFLFPVDLFGGTVMKSNLGFDFGGGKIFSSKFDPHSTGGSILKDIDEDEEYEAYLLALMEVTPSSIPLTLQAGIGMHFVFWTWTHDYQSIYQTQYETNSGTGTSFGAHLAAGYDIPISKTMQLPLFIRADNIFRYGSVMTISLMAGLTLSL